jgi:hypothetical protein
LILQAKKNQEALNQQLKQDDSRDPLEQQASTELAAMKYVLIEQASELKSQSYLLGNSSSRNFHKLRHFCDNGCII